MNILAVDTSGAQAAVAALEGSSDIPALPLAVVTLAEPRQLSSRIIACVDDVLRQASWTLDDVDAIAVGLGPGSWTSLRIGLTTCKTLAQMRGWNLIGVPTFDAMAQAVWRFLDHATNENGGDDEAGTELPQHFILLATARCRPGEIYGKIYECQPDAVGLIQPEWVGEPSVMADAAAVEALARSINAPLVVVGDAASAVSDVLAERQETHLVLSVPIEALVVELGRAGEAALEQGQVDNPLELQPLYIAPSAAERNAKLVSDSIERKV
jgi:tRNA threonylcarbamoyladenosine biosynthesis protein TsaB